MTDQKPKIGECFMCGGEATAWDVQYLCQDCLNKIRVGIKALKEGKVRPWSEVKKELGLG